MQNNETVFRWSQLEKKDLPKKLSCKEIDELNSFLWKDAVKNGHSDSTKVVLMLLTEQLKRQSDINTKINYFISLLAVMISLLTLFK